MEHKLQPVRGTRDLYGDEIHIHQHIVNIATDIASRYGFKAISLPVFEFTSTFQRTLGTESDIVSKEMYSFVDKSNESITLRPEFTAGMARAFISNGFHQALPVKFFCHGPVFRYERPQSMRYRQFHQINFEFLGVEDHRADIELIALAYHYLQQLETISRGDRRF